MWFPLFFMACGAATIKHINTTRKLKLKQILEIFNFWGALIPPGRRLAKLIKKYSGFQILGPASSWPAKYDLKMMFDENTTKTYEIQ